LTGGILYDALISEKLGKYCIFLYIMLSQAQDNFVVVAHTEQTPELRDFWLSRYRHFLGAKYFRLRDKTLEVITKTEQVGLFTPTGEIDISSCLNTKHQIDTTVFQEVVFIAVRYLDACLDTIQFAQDASTVIQNYRKIGVGLTGLDVYLGEQDNGKRQEYIDALGEQFSKLVYRASEALAEEKSAYGAFPQDKKILRSRLFERWINLDTGSVQDGATLSLTQSQQQVDKSSWELVPRRNSHLLALPNSQAWNKWNDRDSKQEEPDAELPNKQTKKIDTRIALPSTQTTRFDLGELVKIINKDSIYYGRVGQVVEYIPGLIPQIKLAALDTEIESIGWVEEDLGALDTQEVIQKVDGFVSVEVVVVLLNPTGSKVLVDDRGQLPHTTLVAAQLPEQAITALLSTLAGGFVDITESKVITQQSDPAKRIIRTIVRVTSTSDLSTFRWSTIDGPTLTNQDKSAVQECIRSTDVVLRLLAKITKLEDQLEEQKTLTQIQKREASETTWLKNFGELAGSVQMTLASGHSFEISIGVQDGRPHNLSITPLGEVPNNLVTIMKLVELSVVGRVHDTTQLALALTGLANIAKNSNDSTTLEIIETLQKVLGITVDQAL
jgi:Ribonucleotide reductase, barrel domain